MYFANFCQGYKPHRWEKREMGNKNQMKQTEGSEAGEHQMKSDEELRISTWILLKSLSSSAGPSKGIRKSRDYQQNGKMGSFCYIRMDVNPELNPLQLCIHRETGINIYKHTVISLPLSMMYALNFSILMHLSTPLVSYAHTHERSTGVF